MLQPTYGLGLGAVVSPSGDISIPGWCSFVPWGDTWLPQCKPAGQQEQQWSTENLAICQQYAQEHYPVTSTILGQTTACKLVAGEYNLQIGLGVGALALLTILVLR
jgi:hypothetical protein